MYYGWYVLLVAAAAMVGTLPGRTQGLGLITEPLLADLGLGRVAYAEVNLWATLVGSAGAIGVGHLLDRFGSRVVLTTVALALGLVVDGDEPDRLRCRTGGVDHADARARTERAVGGEPGDDRAVVRAEGRHGDGALQRDAERRVHDGVSRRGRAGPAARLAHGVARHRRRAHRRPGAALLERRASRPRRDVAAPGRSAGARQARRRPAARRVEEFTWAQALAEPAFWIFAVGTALYGLVASGIGLFNESILAERGFGAGVYYQTLVVTAMTALAGNSPAAGWRASCRSRD